jgi:regulation of enolase protein 1 (concanavalin A-like superfamily)
LEGDRLVGTLVKGKFAVIAAAAVLILCVTSQMTLVSANVIFQDEFSGALSGGWTFVNPLGTASYDLGINPGYLRIKCPANLDIGTNDNAPRLMRSITGDFIASTKVSGDWTAKGTHAGIMVWIGTSYFIRVEVRDTNTVQIGGKNGGSFSNPPTTSLGSAVNPIYLQLSKIGTTVSGAWSSDGATWHTFGSMTFTGTGTTTVGLFVINQNASPATYSADFDWFHISDTTPSVLPEYPVGVFGAAAAIAGAYVFFKAKDRVKPALHL